MADVGETRNSVSGDVFGLVIQGRDITVNVNVQPAAGAASPVWDRVDRPRMSAIETHVGRGRPASAVTIRPDRPPPLPRALPPEPPRLAAPRRTLSIRSLVGLLLAILAVFVGGYIYSIQPSHPTPGPPPSHPNLTTPVPAGTRIFFDDFATTGGHWSTQGDEAATVDTANHQLAFTVHAGENAYAAPAAPGTDPG